MIVTLTGTLAEALPTVPIRCPCFTRVPGTAVTSPSRQYLVT